MRVLLAVALFLCWCRGGAAQFFHDPPLSFQPMTFDLVHRGTFNMSYCSRELLNCWEIVKPDHMCLATDNLGWYWTVYESICGVVREYCDDGLRDQDLYPHAFGLLENYCPPNQYDFVAWQGRRGGQHAPRQGGAASAGRAVTARGAVPMSGATTAGGAVSVDGANTAGGTFTWRAALVTAGAVGAGGAGGDLNISEGVSPAGEGPAARGRLINYFLKNSTSLVLQSL